MEFLPTIWSETMLTQLKRRYVGIANCSHIYSDDIKGKGSEIKICGLYDIGVNDYDPVDGIGSPMRLQNYAKSILVDQTKYFNFMIDDIENVQSNAGAMQVALSRTTDMLSNIADQYVYNLCYQTTNVIEKTNVTADTVLDALISARTYLFKKNASNADDIVFEISPEVAELVYKAKMNLSCDNGELLENGCIGRFMGSKIYVSNNIQSEVSPDCGTYHKCLVRTKRAVAFAERLSEIIKYRPENYFSDAIKGLHVYGAAVLYPNELLCLKIEIMD